MSFSFTFIHLCQSLRTIGLDWNKLKEKLNPDFDWESAVQRALDNDEAIEEVCFLISVSICCSFLLH